MMSRGARRCFRMRRPATSISRPAPPATPATDCGWRKPPAAASQDSLPNAAAWVPVSITTRKDGSKGVMPHFIDRAKPGVIAVTRDGARFANEGNSYHDFVQEMMKTAKPGEEIAAFLLCDHRALRKYGLGCVPPFPMPLGHHLRTGYLKRGATLAELAASNRHRRQGTRGHGRGVQQDRRATGRIRPSARARAPITATRATRCMARTPASRRSRTDRSTRSKW